MSQGSRSLGTEGGRRIEAAASDASTGGGSKGRLAGTGLHGTADNLEDSRAVLGGRAGAGRKTEVPGSRHGDRGTRSRFGGRRRSDRGLSGMNGLGSHKGLREDVGSLSHWTGRRGLDSNGVHTVVVVAVGRTADRRDGTARRLREEAPWFFHTTTSILPLTYRTGKSSTSCSDGCSLRGLKS